MVSGKFGNRHCYELSYIQVIILKFSSLSLRLHIYVMFGTCNPTYNKQNGTVTCIPITGKMAQNIRTLPLNVNYIDLEK